MNGVYDAGLKSLKFLWLGKFGDEDPINSVVNSVPEDGKQTR